MKKGRWIYKHSRLTKRFISIINKAICGEVSQFCKEIEGRKMENIIKKETMGSVEIFILAPGVGQDAVRVSADKESSNLYVEAVPVLTGALAEEVELNFKHTIEVDKKYDVATASVAVLNGIVSIRVMADCERIVDIHPVSSGK